jgi:threonine dehydrogenase-like Zn-dependent dehydrogenase
MEKTMRSLWLENQTLKISPEFQIPVPGKNEALIRVRLAGICSTDLEMVKGYYPFTGVPGHEFVGEVAAAPDNPSWVGKRVVGEINITCGTCRECRAGRQTHCLNRSVLGIKQKDGAFAEYLTLPIRNLHAVPDEVPDELAVFCEPLAAALEIQTQIQVHPDDRVLVIGAGRLGQLIARTLALAGCDLQVLVRTDAQRKLLDSIGAAIITQAELPQRSMDLVVEATGSPDGFLLAREAVRPQGTIVLKSTYKGQLNLDVSSLVVDEIKLVGSRCGPFAPAIRMLATGLIDPANLIDATFPLEEWQAAYASAAAPGTFKVLLRP